LHDCWDFSPDLLDFYSNRWDCRSHRVDFSADHRDFMDDWLDCAADQANFYGDRLDFIFPAQMAVIPQELQFYR